MPLPANVDWKVRTEYHEEGEAFLVKLCFVNSNETKVKMRIGLPVETDEAWDKAEAFIKSLERANLQSGVPQDDEMECRMSVLPQFPLSLPFGEDEELQRKRLSDDTLHEFAKSISRSLSPPRRRMSSGRRRHFPQAA